MKIRLVTSDFAVSSQIQGEDIPSIVAQGYKAVINNRPDGEGEDQPTNTTIQATALRHGLAYRYIPIFSGRLSDEDVERFSRALQDLPGPVLAYCLSGQRSMALWMLDQAQHTDPDILLDQASQMDYNLYALKPRLQVRYQK